MTARGAQGLPARLGSLRRRFEQARKIRKVRSPIPEPLWAAAVKMAGTYGIQRTANAIRLSSNTLKKRIEQKASAGDEISQAGAGARFIELVAPTSVGPCQCTLELENVRDAKMRVQLKSVEMPDLAAMSRSFWNLES